MDASTVCGGSVRGTMPVMADSDIAVSPESESGATVSFLGSRGIGEFARYFVASLIALSADTGSLYLMTSVIGVPYLMSGALAFVLGLIVIYILSITWVFEKRGNRSLPMEFLVFAVIGIVGLAINESILWLLTGYFGLYYLVSKVASVCIVFSWNFAARKWLLFR